MELFFPFLFSDCSFLVCRNTIEFWYTDLVSSSFAGLICYSSSSCFCRFHRIFNIQGHVICTQSWLYFCLSNVCAFYLILPSFLLALAWDALWEMTWPVTPPVYMVYLFTNLCFCVWSVPLVGSKKVGPFCQDLIWREPSCQVLPT